MLLQFQSSLDPALAADFHPRANRRSYSLLSEGSPRNLRGSAILDSGDAQTQGLADMKSTKTASYTLGLLNFKSIASTAFISALLAFSLLSLGSNTGAIVASIISAVLFLLLTSTMALSRVTVGENLLQVGALPYRVTFSLDEVFPDEARIVDVSKGPNLRWRKNGIGLPGLCIGHFSTDSERPVFAAVSGRKGRVFLPTKRTYDLLITVEEPEALLAHLRQTKQDGADQNNP